MGHLMKRLGPSLPSRVLAIGARALGRPQMDRLRLEGLQLRYLRTAISVSGTLAGWPVTARVEQLHTDQFDAEWVTSRNAAHSTDGVILYLHGGGYVASSPAAYRCVTERLSTLTALPVLALAYRRAPEHPYPAALDDALEAYLWLLDSGFDPSRITVAGDSAGGHLALGLLVRVARHRLPMPAAVTLFSPLLDPTLTSAVRRDAAMPDPVITPTFAARCAEAFHPDGDFADPELAPLRTSMAMMRTFPPIQTHVGATECFVGDSERLHSRLTKAGVSNKLIVSRGQVHSYVTMSRFIPEAGRALRRAANFIRSAIDEQGATPSSSPRRVVQEAR